MWNWQQDDWPHFQYDKKAIEELEAKFLKQSGMSLGAFKHISDEDKELLKVELISEEALQTSKIEGELLDRDSLQSSIFRQFGMKVDNRSIPPAEQGIATMMVNLYKTFDKPISHEYLYDWHRYLMEGRKQIKIGSYRTHEDPMQVVSGVIYKPTVHFEAPPSHAMNDEMSAFMEWFNDTAPKGKNPLPALTRAAIAHLYFVCIHPFEDGNGRIGRAISEKSLAQNLGQPTLIALAYTIERSRKDYYKALERANKSNEITNWFLYFAKTVLDAQNYTMQRIEFIINKTKFYDKFQGQFNARQEKVIDRIFREGIDGFKGGLSAENYISITGAPRTTTTRDLNDLVDKGVLTKTGELRYTRYYLNIQSGS